MYGMEQKHVRRIHDGPPIHIHILVVFLLFLQPIWKPGRDERHGPLPVKEGKEGKVGKVGKEHVSYHSGRYVLHQVFHIPIIRYSDRIFGILAPPKMARPFI